MGSFFEAGFSEAGLSEAATIQYSEWTFVVPYRGQPVPQHGSHEPHFDVCCLWVGGFKLSEHILCVGTVENCIKAKAECFGKFLFSSICPHVIQMLPTVYATNWPSFG